MLLWVWISQSTWVMFRFLGGLEGQTGAQWSRDRVMHPPRSALALKLLRGVLRTNDPQARQRISERLHEVALHRLTKL